MAKPGHGYLQGGFNWKPQSGAQRRDIEGRRYEALNHLTHDFRFAYATGNVGLYPRLEASFLLSYLWASERFDEAAEEPDIRFQGFSDMWVGLKYQVRPGAWPMAVEGVARLPYLYRGPRPPGAELSDGQAEQAGARRGEFDAGHRRKAPP